MPGIQTKIIYVFEVSAQEYGLMIKALRAHGKPAATAFAEDLERRRQAIREEVIRQFQASIISKEKEDAS